MADEMHEKGEWKHGWIIFSSFFSSSKGRLEQREAGLPSITMETVFCCMDIKTFNLKLGTGEDMETALLCSIPKHILSDAAYLF